MENEMFLFVELDVLSVMAMIANVQLACRHPGNIGSTRKVAEAIVRDWQAWLAVVQPETAAIMEMGWNPDFDIRAQ